MEMPAENLRLSFRESVRLSTYMSGGFHDALGGPHLSAVTVRMAEALVCAVEVESVQQLGHDT